MPWLPADPELSERLRRQALTELAEFVADAEAEFAGRIASEPASAAFPWLWRSRVEILFSAPCCLSLRRDLDIRSGGVDGSSATQSILWDRRTRRVVPLDGLLDLESAKPALDAALRAAFREAKRDRGLSASGQDERPPFDLPEARTDSVFTLIAGLRPGIAQGLLFHFPHFPPDALGPHVEGSYRLPVPASRFAAYLRPRFRHLFTAECGARRRQPAAWHPAPSGGNFREPTASCRKRGRHPWGSGDRQSCCNRVPSRSAVPSGVSAGPRG